MLEKVIFYLLNLYLRGLVVNFKAKSILRLSLLSLLSGAGLMLLYLLSCSTFRKLAKVQKPKVSVDNVRFTGISFDDIGLAFDVKIDNPNQLSAKLAGFDYDLHINDASFLKGQQDSELNIEAMGQSTLEVPLTLNFKDLYKTYRSLQNQDSSEYKIDLGLDFDLPVLGKTRIPVSKKGFVPLIKLPTVKVASLKVQKMGLSGADLDLKLQIDNPNAFNLLASNLNYNFSVNGQSWVKGTSPENIRVDEKGESIMSIPISLDFFSLGQTALQLLSGDQSINYSFQGNVDLNTSMPMLKQFKLPIDKSGQLDLSR